jgi:hypothetical protein
MYISIWKSLTYYSTMQQSITKLVPLNPKRKKTPIKIVISKTIAIFASE